MKKVWLMLALVLTAALCASALAEEDASRTAADALVPEDARFVAWEWDDGLKEYDYVSGDGAYRYCVSVHPEQNAVAQYEVEAVNDRGGRELTLGETDIEKIVLDMYEDASILDIAQRRDDGAWYYRVFIRADEYMGKMEFHPETGALLEADIYFRGEWKTRRAEWMDRDDGWDDDWDDVWDD